MVIPLEHVIHCVCNISSYCQIFGVIYAANLLSTREFINLPLSGVWVKLIYTTQQHKSQDLRGFYNLHSVQHPWFEWENTSLQNIPKLPVELAIDQTIPCHLDQPDVLHCIWLMVIWSISPLPSHQKGKGKRLEPEYLIRSSRFLHSFIISCIKLQIHFNVWSHHSEKQEGQPLWCRFSSPKAITGGHIQTGDPSRANDFQVLFDISSLILSLSSPLSFTWWLAKSHSDKSFTTM